MKEKSRTTLRRTCSSPMIFFFGFLSLATAYSQEYSVDGHLETSIRSGIGDRGLNTDFAFHAEVRSNNYNIKVWIAGKETDYQDYVFDGTNIYILHHITHSKPLDRSTSTNAPLQYPASIEERDVPPNDGWYSQFIWFAYASQDYISTLTNEYNVMLPIWSPEDPLLRKQPFNIPVFFKLLQQPRGLPSGASFINDGYYRSYNPATRSLDVFKLKTPYDNGFTNAIFSVLTTTNINNYYIPEEWIFIIYSTPFDNDAPFERQVIRGHTTSVDKSAPDASTLPKFSGIADVADYRVHGTVNYHGTNLNYAYAAAPITNGQWIAPEQLGALRKKIEERVQAKIRTHELQAEKQNGRARVHRSIILVFLFGSFIALPFIFWRVLRQKKRS